MNHQTILHKIIAPYLVYIGLFIGTGFLSGSIVHYPLNHVRFGSIGALGAIIFSAASTINEAYFNKRNFKEEGVIKIIIFSLILSIGIGMVSGGVQHFDEEALYASYLIPIGIFVSLVGYMLKNNLDLGLRKLTLITAIAIVILLPLGFGLRSYALSVSTDAHTNSEDGHHDE